jgi:hypothetical protein
LVEHRFLAFLSKLLNSKEVGPRTDDSFESI